MLSPHRVFWIALTVLIALGAIALVSTFTTVTAARPPDRPARPASIVVVSWNDLGMHCYNRDFNDLAVLPPANTLWAQVVKSAIRRKSSPPASPSNTSSPIIPTPPASPTSGASILTRQTERAEVVWTVRAAAGQYGSGRQGPVRHDGCAGRSL